MKWLAVCYLGFNAWTDARKKEIDLRITAVAGAVCLVLRAAGLDGGWKITFLSFFPCIVLFLMGRLLQNGIGLGDAVVAGMMGVLMPAGEVMGCLILGFFMAGFWGILGQIRGNRKRDEKIPLVPFLLVSYLVRCLM